MKISYQYTNYPHSKSATRWSRFASLLSVTAIFPWSIVIGYLIHYLVLSAAKLSDTSKMFISFGSALALVILAIVFCRRQEKKCAARDAAKASQNDQS